MRPSIVCGARHKQPTRSQELAAQPSLTGAVSTAFLNAALRMAYVTVKATEPLVSQGTATSEANVVDA